MGIEELVVKHRLERGEIAAAHRRIALVLEAEDFLVAAHRQTSLAVSPGTSGLQLAWRLLSCVDGPRLARENVACRTEVACSHVSGLFTQSGWTAGPDGVREPRPHHSSGIDVPMKRQASLGCVGSTDCA